MPQNEIQVQADPSKNFFIEMLTKDIKLIDCILDLIDNSVDSILRNTNFDPMSGLTKPQKNSLKKYEISIEFDKNKFVIKDNSSGADKETVFNKAFRFGADSDAEEGIGLSVYGIGMKRSFLKMGKIIEFESRTTKDKNEVNIDVDAWLGKDEWNFEGTSSKLVNNKKTGTTIKITRLNENIAASFDNENVFRKKLLEKIEPAYGIFLKNGLTIKVNSQKAVGFIPSVSRSKDLKPSVETFSKYNVKTKIIAGITQEAESKANGWFIFCNGRMILSADKSELTGWDNGLRKFHPSTSKFVGFVYFESTSANSLPWATTKDGVDYESAIYQYTLREMVKIAKPVVDFLVSQYNSNKEMGKVRELIKTSKEVSVGDLSKNESFKAKLDNTTKQNEEIIYSVPKKDIEKVKKILDDAQISNKKIGEKTFYYFIDHEE